jgi:hypothetical protein
MARVTALLCPTCSVEHATDNVRVECSKRGFVQPQIECPQYKPTREKRLEDALRELCEALDGTTTDGGIRVHVAIERACELIPRKP